MRKSFLPLPRYGRNFSDSSVFFNSIQRSNSNEYRKFSGSSGALRNGITGYKT